MDAFVPLPLPPRDPALDLDGPLADRLRIAEESLRRLELAGDLVPSIAWFLYAFVRKEAVISSQIEGTQATLVDLLRVESDEAFGADAEIREICNYVDALDGARAQMADPNGLPLSLRLLHEAHRRLMQSVRGADKMPGEVRRTQNWVGGARPGNAAYVPPPPQLLDGLLRDLERYLHEPDPHPPLVRAGLAHVQFESIHPYLDGNGRIGRLLITLLLEHWGLLRSPLLYLSLHFKRHRGEYYRRLDRVRTDGDWEGWLDFYLDGVAIIAGEALETARVLFRIVQDDRARLLRGARTSVSALRLFDALPEHPVLTTKTVTRLLEVTKPTAGRAIDALVGEGVLVEASGRRRDRWFTYERYLERLRAGTE